MTALELIDLLGGFHPDTEVRIGDQIEQGPYLHQAVGGVWKLLDDESGVRGIVLCASDDDLWKEEFTIEDEEAPELPQVWKPPS